MAEVAGTVGSHRTRQDSSALLTFLIADIRGYTRFTVENGDEAAASMFGDSESSHGDRKQSTMQVRRYLTSNRRA